LVVTVRTVRDSCRTEVVMCESGRKATRRLARRSGSIGNMASPTLAMAMSTTSKLKEIIVASLLYAGPRGQFWPAGHEGPSRPSRG